MHKLVLAALLPVIFSAPAAAQIAFDAAASGEAVNGTSVSYNHNVTGTSVLLVVGVHTYTANDVVNAPTYNGVALTLIDKVKIGAPASWVYQFALANAPQGSHAVSVTTSAAVDFAVVSASYTGVSGLPADNFTRLWDPVGAAPISTTTTLTPNTNNTWTILVGASTGPPLGAGSGSTMRASSGETLSPWPHADRLAIFDSNGPISPAASTSMTITGSQPYTEFGTVMASYGAAETTSSGLPLLHSHSLTYLGGFRVPTTCGTYIGSTGGSIIAFNPAGNNGAGSLYIGTRAFTIAEITVPTPVDSATVTALNTAACLQDFTEPTEGVKAQGNVGGDASAQAHPSGMAVVDGKLWINNGVYYDAGADQTLSLLSRPLHLGTTGQVKGLYGLQSQSAFIPPMAARSVAEISSDWTAAMGGNLFLSKFNETIVTANSYGPSAIVTSSTTLTGAAQTTYAPIATPLYYPGSHPITGDSDPGNVLGQTYPFWSQANVDGSLVQPRGTSSLLVFQVAAATKGSSEGGYGYGYGCGCASPVSPGSATCPGSTETCAPHGFYYDLERGAKGTHGFPYVYQVVGFDMNDLAAAKAGTMAPWEIRPYDTWEITFPISPSSFSPHRSTRLSNATYDSANNKIYIAQVGCCDSYGLDRKPLIHVFQVNP